MKKKPVQRSVTLILSLTQVAAQFKYNLEVDQFDDVYHDGYSSKDIRKTDMSFSSALDDVNKYFPQIVARSLEDAERDAYAVAIRKERLNSLEECLLKIDLLGGGAEYQDMDGSMISEKAGITAVEIDEVNDSISITISNPEHLINTVINGVGYFSADTDAYEPATNEELSAKFHNLSDFFEVYGASKPSGDLSSQYSPSVNDKYLEESITEQLAELSVEEVAEAVLELAQQSEDEVLVSDFAKFVSFSEKDIKNEVKKLNKTRSETLEDRIK